MCSELVTSPLEPHVVLPPPQGHGSHPKFLCDLFASHLPSLFLNFLICKMHGLLWSSQKTLSALKMLWIRNSVALVRIRSWLIWHAHKGGNHLRGQQGRSSTWPGHPLKSYTCPFPLVSSLITLTLLCFWAFSSAVFSSWDTPSSPGLQQDTAQMSPPTWRPPCFLQGRVSC